MTGGLLNLTAVGNQNVFLTGNPKRPFSKQHIHNILISGNKNSV